MGVFHKSRCHAVVTAKTCAIVYLVHASGVESPSADVAPVTDHTYLSAAAAALESHPAA